MHSALLLNDYFNTAKDRGIFRMISILIQVLLTPLFFLLGIILWSLIGWVIFYIVSQVEYYQNMWEIKRNIKHQRKGKRGD